MNPSRFAIGLVGLSLAGLWYCAGGAEPLAVSRAADMPPRVATPLAHENLSVYLVYGPDAVPDAKVMSLSEALERQVAVVHETSNVNVLAVENRSPDCDLFVQSGDIVKGGKQDRMAATDMLLPPMSGVVAMKAHCVEQGRWTGRGAEDARQFTSSTKCAAGKELKLANATGQQPAVWQNVSENQSKLNASLNTTVNAAASPTSFQLTLEAPAVQAKVAEYEAALAAAGADRAGVVGVVFVVNGQVTGAEVYGSNALFRKAWPKLLNAAAVEAVADRTDKPAAAPPSAREVERYLASGASPEPAGVTGIACPDAAQGQVAVENFALMRTVSRRDSTNAQPPVLFSRGSANGNEEVVQNAGGAVPAAGTRPAALARSRPALAGSPADAAANPIAAPTPIPVTFQEFTVTGASQPTGLTQPSTDGNRLSSNRTENSSTLMVESRDPSRQNAIIHRSYLKK